jgi:hypothetical protein
MGGQACVLYGGAELSCDTDSLVVADPTNLARLQSALAELEVDRRYWAPLKRELEQLRHAR